MKSLLDEFPKKPDKWFLKLVIALGRDVIILQVLLSVESDLLGLDLSVLHINFVADKHNGDVFAHSDQILIP